VTGSRGRSEPMVAAALRYAWAGWPVFPCMPGEKVPATRHGFLDATTDPDKIAWWWRRDVEHNVAIATGRPGPDVLDVDVRADGNGFAALGRLRREGLLDGAGAYVRTPSGGLHAYFTGSEQGNGRLSAHHLDFRSLGGYIVAPPSGVEGRRYELIRRHEGRLEQGQGGLDWAAVRRLLDPQPQRSMSGAGAGGTDPSRLAAWVARLPEGNRNDGLFWAASRALESGVTDLAELAEAAHKTGLDEREIARTIASARRHAEASGHTFTRVFEPRHADRETRSDTPTTGRPEPAAAKRREPESRLRQAEAPKPGIAARDRRPVADLGSEAEAS
jgi:Bifunctional DNA primase/polymerase, N-terminal